MEVQRKIVASIENFDRWDRPWDFYPYVSSLLAPNTREELERIWAAANDTASWATGKDLTQGCSLADARLSNSYPWLSVVARRQLVKGAAYQWR